VLTDFKDHFAELAPRETVTFVAGQAVETVLERSFARKIGQVIADITPARDDTGDLTDREHQLEIFRWREGHITASVARRFKQGLDEDHDPFEVFRAVQNHAVDAARAHIDRVILESFVRKIESCEDDSLRHVLNVVCDLYALWTIESERAFYQEHGRLTGPRCKAITREVNRLCNEVRFIAGDLVDAFGIPDEVLRAPIGLRNP
jgi:acyl-CoA oxidase